MSKTAMYGWYSQKQFENNKENKDYKEMYYQDTNDNIVLITEVNSNINFKSKFNDVIFLGELKKWHGHTR